MLSTKAVVDELRGANPGATVNEDRVRHAIRRGAVAPTSFAGRLAWTDEDVLKLAQHLGVAPPTFVLGQHADVGAAVPVANP